MTQKKSVCRDAEQNLLVVTQKKSACRDAEKSACRDAEKMHTRADRRSHAQVEDDWRTIRARDENTCPGQLWQACTFEPHH